MAVLDARNSAIEFDMLALADTSVGVLNSSSASQVTWTSVAGDIVKANGSGFAFSGGVATAGTVSAVRLDFGANGSFDVKVTGLALPLTDLAASDSQPNLPLFWDRMLGGNDTLYSPLAGENLMFGDGLFTISNSGLPVTGDNDTINVGGSAFGTYIGDFVAGVGDGFGGADKLVTTSTLGASLFGDLGHYNGGGTFTGGDDDIQGGAGNDILLGQAGDDQIQGGSGDDHLGGGIGADSLAGGKGNDFLTGGLNADQFVFRPGDGTDTIYDFTDGADKLMLTAFGFPGFIDVFAKALMNGNNLEIDFGGGDKLILLSYSITKFDAGDVIL